MSILKKIPAVKKILSKFSLINNRFGDVENELMQLALNDIDSRLSLKKINHEKINVVFVCHRPNVWGSLKTVYEALKADSFFSVQIVTIPNKEQLPQLGLHHEQYKSEGAEEYWKSYGCINGYNYETKEWLDLRTLKPDYIFFQQPYNDTRCAAYKSWIVSKYAKICYVHYASNFIGNGVLEETTPSDFMNSITYFFTQNSMDDSLIKEHLVEIKNTYTSVKLTGFPRYDNLVQFKDCDSSLWNYPRTGKTFRMIWTPRWCTNEGNCHFFTYKDALLKYCDLHTDVDFIFRPHPQAFAEWNASGEMPEKDALLYKNEYDKRQNAKIDYTKDYLTTFYSSDCLITDVSSIVAEYFLTGKPIVYCHRIDCFNDFSRTLSQGFYWVHNWQELSDTLDMLRSGKDPLKKKREKLMQTAFFIPENGAGNAIKDIIKKDALGE